MSLNHASLHYLHRVLPACWLSVLLTLGLARATVAQEMDSFERGRARDILKTVKDDIRKNYYDPNLRGIDLEARFKAADEKLQQAQSLGQCFAIIAQLMLDFNDSHTFFVPPQIAAKFEYGLQMQMISDRCLITAVKPGSDAEAKGVKPGDQVLSFSGYKPDRNNLWKISYLFYTLRPQASLRLALQSPSGEQRQVEVITKVQQLKRVLDFSNSMDYTDAYREMEDEGRLNAHRLVEIGENLSVWKMPGFNLEDQQVDSIMDKAKKRELLIIDLRGNGGGYLTTLQRLLGYFFEEDVKIGDSKSRKETKPVLAKTRGNQVFKGKLAVLVDSKSGSAAELFARVIQLNKRGTVIGDQTAGAVMASLRYVHKPGGDTRLVIFSTSVTVADMVMTDGKSLEGIGVTPDESVIPKAEDLASDRDPVLARAAALLGVNFPADKAGKLFPIEWK